SAAARARPALPVRVPVAVGRGGRLGQPLRAVGLALIVGQRELLGREAQACHLRRDWAGGPGGQRARNPGMAGSFSSGGSGRSVPARTASTLARVWAAIASQDRGATAAWRRARRRSRSRLR